MFTRFGGSKSTKCYTKMCCRFADLHEEAQTQTGPYIGSLRVLAKFKNAKLPRPGLVRFSQKSADFRKKKNSSFFRKNLQIVQKQFICQIWPNFHIFGLTAQDPVQTLKKRHKSFAPAPPTESRKSRSSFRCHIGAGGSSCL